MFCAKAPDVEVIDGLVRVTHHAGGQSFTFVYTRSSLIKGMAKAGEALANWDEPATVIPFPAERMAGS